MWKCPECLKQISDGSKICPECGAILEEVEDKIQTEDDVSGQSEHVSATEEKQNSQAHLNSTMDISGGDKDFADSCHDQNHQEQDETFPWTCKKCSEQVPGTFDVCWKCGTTQEGLEDSEFVMEHPDFCETVESQGNLRRVKNPLNCPDCDGSMREIQIIDKGGETLSHHDLEYTAADAERSIWMKRYPITGKITAYMCQECGAVRLFGRSHN